MRKALEAVLAAAWAIQPEYLDVIASIAERENEYHNNLEALQTKLGRPLGNTMRASVRNGVAIIPFEGPMFRRANLMTEFSGATSYDTVAKDFTAALDDPNVSAIIGYFDTPGGEVNGASEMAAIVKAARGKKPLIAYGAGTMASAGLWIASAFDKIYASDTALIGSVGAQMGFSIREPRAGEKSYRFVSSQSPLKNADPATEAGAAEMQRTVDELAAVFISTLAENRGVDEKTVLEKYGQGAVFVAQNALSRGILDGVSTFEQVLANLISEREQMDFSALTAAILAENRPDLVQAIRTEALAGVEKVDAAALRAEGAETERKRIAGIEALAMPGAEAVIAEAKADAAATPEATALKVLAHLRANPGAAADAAKTTKADAALAGIKQTEAELVPPKPVESATQDKASDPVAFILQSAAIAGVTEKE